MKTEPNASAYPADVPGYVRGPGLTKRELFAAMAMQGLVANAEFFEPASVVAWNAVNFADALIAELNKEKKP